MAAIFIPDTTKNSTDADTWLVTTSVWSFAYVSNMAVHIQMDPMVIHTEIPQCSKMLFYIKGS